MERRTYLIGQCALLSVLVFISTFTYLQERAQYSAAFNAADAHRLAMHKARQESKPLYVLPENEITGEAVVNDPNFVHGVFTLAVSGEVTRFNLGIMLRKHYYTIIKREEFARAGRPVKIEIHAFDRYDSSRVNWVAKLIMAPAMEDPLVKINTDKVADLHRKARQDKALRDMVMSHWDKVTSVTFDRAAATAHIDFELASLAGGKKVYSMINSRAGKVIDMIYKQFPHVKHVIIRGYGTARGRDGKSKRVGIFDLNVDRELVGHVVSVDLDYQEAVSSVFKPWIHSGLRA